MLSLLLAVLVPFLSVTVEGQTVSNIEVIEIFRAETPDELEAALTDGYPMPWLEEILNDESIPEEDRYWLDCRVRAVIAINSHTFFDAVGNPNTFEADWIMPGEDYWRENFVLSPHGDQTVFHPVGSGGNLLGEIGQLLDRFGQDIGETALTARLFQGSRDGSMWASSLCRVEGKYRLVLLYSDASYFVSPIEMSSGRCGVSQSGEYVILAARGLRDFTTGESTPSRAILVDKTGKLIWEIELEMSPVGNFVPVISPDDRYCAVSSYAPGELRTNRLQIFDMETGQEVLRVENPNAAQLSFSPNGSHLNASGAEAFSMNMLTGNIDWSSTHVSRPNLPVANLMRLDSSNDADLISGMIWPSSRQGSDSVLLTLFDNSGNILACDNIYGNMDISPNGALVITENYQSYDSDWDITPIIIRRVIRGCE